LIYIEVDSGGSIPQLSRLVIITPASVVYEHRDYIFMTIYFIVNLNTGNVYVGQTTRNALRRWTEHKTYLRKSKHQNSHLQSAWNKYGENSFIFEVIKTVDTAEDLNLLENYYITMLSPKIYNLCSGGVLHRKFSEETRRRMSVSAKLRKRTSVSDETRKKLSDSHKGKCVDDATRKKLAEITANRWKCGKFDNRKYNQYFTQTVEYSDKMAKISRPQGWSNVILLSPSGQEYSDITNLKKFCKEHNLHYHALRNAIINKPRLDGKPRNYKGWKIKIAT
jgi:group I intron endonuclease